MVKELGLVNYGEEGDSFINLRAVPKICQRVRWMSCRKTILTAVAVLLAVAMVISVKASPETAVAIDPPEVKDLEAGASFTVDVTITDADNVFGWQFNVTFDPGVLSVASVAEGPFLKSFNATVWPTPEIDNSGGYVLACSSFMPPYPPQGVSGAGVLGNITFTVKSGGSSALHFDHVGTYLRTVVGGATLAPISYVAHDSSFSGTGGTGGLQIPLEVIAGAIVAVVVVVVAIAFYIRRRRQ